MFKVIALLLVGVCFSSGQKVDVVDLTYVFEARCPYSLDFLMNQFYPGYQKIGDYVNLTLISYAKEDDNGDMYCAHGENECFISRAHVCTYDHSGLSQSQETEFLHCSELKAYDGAEVTSADIKDCLSSVLPEVSWDEVESCMNSEKAETLLKEKHDVALSYGLTYVPSLVFFGTHDTDLETSARGNFVSTICGLLSTPPEVCNENSS